MSRTIRGSKPVDYEFWSARPFNKYGGAIGKYAKKRTHRTERMTAKRQVYKEVTQ